MAKFIALAAVLLVVLVGLLAAASAGSAAGPPPNRDLILAAGVGPTTGRQAVDAASRAGLVHQALLAPSQAVGLHPLVSLRSSSGVGRPAVAVATVATDAGGAADREAPAQFEEEGVVNVVMGFAVCKPGELSGLAGHFVRSLRATGFAGLIMLGVNSSADEGDERWCRRWKVTAMPVHETGTGVPLALLRFQIYSEWLAFGNSTGYVLCSDVRDAFFQSDPFDEFVRLGSSRGPREPVIQVALEWGWDAPADLAARQRGSRIGDNDFNRGWVANCMGRDAADAIGAGRVLCSGTTMGTRAGMSAYFKMMRDAIAERPQCKDHGVDQGFHNFVIHGHVASARASRLRVDMPEIGTLGAVMLTVGSMCSPPPSLQNVTPPDHSYTGVLRRDSEGFVVRGDGSRAPLVHQCDRCFNQFYASGWLDRHFGSHLD